MPDPQGLSAEGLEMTAHRWVLVSDEDPDQTEVCSRCGSQRNRHGRLTGKARISGGWPVPNCEDPDALTKLHAEVERLHAEKDEAQLQEHMAKNAEARFRAALEKAKSEIETHWRRNGSGGYLLRHAHKTICDALALPERGAEGEASP